jgi:hypothetical protein
VQPHLITHTSSSRTISEQYQASIRCCFKSHVALVNAIQRVAFYGSRT